MKESMIDSTTGKKTVELFEVNEISMHTLLIFIYSGTNLHTLNQIKSTVQHFFVHFFLAQPIGQFLPNYIQAFMDLGLLDKKIIDLYDNLRKNQNSIKKTTKKEKLSNNMDVKTLISESKLIFIINLYVLLMIDNSIKKLCGMIELMKRFQLSYWGSFIQLYSDICFLQSHVTWLEEHFDYPYNFNLDGKDNLLRCLLCCLDDNDHVSIKQNFLIRILKTDVKLSQEYERAIRLKKDYFIFKNMISEYINNPQETFIERLLNSHWNTFQ